MAAPLASYAQLTLADLGKRLDRNGDISNIIEVLVETNEILNDPPWLQASNDTYDEVTRRTSQPSGTYRKYNKGVAAEKSNTMQIKEGIAMLQSYSQVDKDLADSTGDPKGLRNTEAVAFIEGMGVTLTESLIYGSLQTTPEEFDGLAVRMANLAATANVIGNGGTGSDLTSIFIVQWGAKKANMIYPKGHKSMGIEHRDLGEETNTDSSGLMHQIYRDWFGVNAGLSLSDERCIARLANIEDGGTSNTFDEDYLITLLNRMPRAGKGAKLYLNDTVQTQMEIKLKDKTNVYYTAASGEGLAGEHVMRFRGNPVRMVDQIIITEAALT